jgi:hypothetical protein
MNRDEIMAMQAGQDLDQLISQVVFGHTVDEWNERFFANKTGYSTNISTAWEIVEKLGLSITQKDFRLFPPEYEKSRWMADTHLRGNGEFWLAWGNTAPLAICRAALLVVSGDATPAPTATNGDATR